MTIMLNGLLISLKLLILNSMLEALHTRMATPMTLLSPDVISLLYKNMRVCDPAISDHRAISIAVSLLLEKPVFPKKTVQTILNLSV